MTSEIWVPESHDMLETVGPVQSKSKEVGIMSSAVSPAFVHFRRCDPSILGGLGPSYRGLVPEFNIWPALIHQSS
jgi:hypothetical protein